MKVALLFALSLVSLGAQAKTSQYIVSSPYVVEATPEHRKGDLALCPPIKGAAIETVDGQLKAKSITLAVGTRNITAESTGSNKVSQSDIGELTTDYFNIDEDTTIGADRNNDGDYPATDLPGHFSVHVRGFFAPGRTFTCTYGLEAIR